MPLHGYISHFSRQGMNMLLCTPHLSSYIMIWWIMLISFCSRNPFCKIKLCVRIRRYEMYVFSESLTCFVFFLSPFWDSPFCPITDPFIFAKCSILVLHNTRKHCNNWEYWHRWVYSFIYCKFVRAELQKILS